MFQIILKEYNGSSPAREEVWALDENERVQSREPEELPVRIECLQKDMDGGRHFELRVEALADLSTPVSLSLETVEEEWNQTEYVFMPAAVYDGNRMESKHIPYPPYWAEKTEPGWKSVITDIPRLSNNGKDGRIQFLSGDMSTPVMGYFSEKEHKGMFLSTAHIEDGRYTGFTVEEKGGKAYFRVSSPGVREEKIYFFGDLPDGSGFYPTCDYPSTDEGKLLKKGEMLNLDAEYREVHAADIIGYLSAFNEIRKNIEKGTEFCSIPFSMAYETVKEKVVCMNFSKEGYLMVGTGETIPSYWQAGWVGGGMNPYPFLLEDNGTAKEEALSTLRFIAEKLQRSDGWYVPMYANGTCYGDAFMDTSKPVLLVRKDADLLYFMLKQAFCLKEQEKESTQSSQNLLKTVEESIVRQADAFVRFFEKHGQLGQFIDMDTEEILAGDTASAAIAPAGLALAYEYFNDRKYLDTAEQLGKLYRDDYLKKGLTNGGPGEICQAPDSESAFGLLESFVQLYETTGKDEWLDAAKEAFELAVTWVVSYDFAFPENSTAAKLGAHTRGTVFANAQNKHSAPGICTLSGNSMLKLYRFTGDEKYLRWMSRISHALSQFVSLKDRPVDTLAGKPLPAGFFNERVQMSDWEGKHTVGEFLYGSNWPETTMLQTYVEIPGIYVDLDRGVIRCSDHVKVEKAEESDGGLVLTVSNPTGYDADVTILADHSQSGGKLGHSYFNRMTKAAVPAGGKVTVKI